MAMPTLENQRQSDRKRVLKGAKIAFAARCASLPCVVRDVSETGARLQVKDQSSVPETFELLIELDGFEVACEVVWRKCGEVGVQFLDVPTIKNPTRRQIVSSSVPKARGTLRRLDAPRRRAAAEQDAQPTPREDMPADAGPAMDEAGADAVGHPEPEAAITAGAAPEIEVEAEPACEAVVETEAEEMQDTAPTCENDDAMPQTADDRAISAEQPANDDAQAEKYCRADDQVEALTAALTTLGLAAADPRLESGRAAADTVGTTALAPPPLSPASPATADTTRDTAAPDETPDAAVASGTPSSPHSKDDAAMAERAHDNVPTSASREPGADNDTTADAPAVPPAAEHETAIDELPPLHHAPARFALRPDGLPDVEVPMFRDQLLMPKAIDTAPIEAPSETPADHAAETSDALSARINTALQAPLRAASNLTRPVVQIIPAPIEAESAREETHVDAAAALVADAVTQIVPENDATPAPAAEAAASAQGNPSETAQVSEASDVSLAARAPETAAMTTCEAVETLPSDEATLRPDLQAFIDLFRPAASAAPEPVADVPAELEAAPEPAAQQSTPPTFAASEPVEAAAPTAVLPSDPVVDTAPAESETPTEAVVDTDAIQPAAASPGPAIDDAPNEANMVADPAPAPVPAPAPAAVAIVDDAIIIADDTPGPLPTFVEMRVSSQDLAVEATDVSLSLDVAIGADKKSAPPAIDPAAFDEVLPSPEMDGYVAPTPPAVEPEHATVDMAGEGVVEDIAPAPEVTAAKMPSDATESDSVPNIPILIAEDDPDDRLFMRDAFAESDYDHEIAFVENGEELLAYLNGVAPYEDAPRPGLILLDLNMPKMDGRTALLHIKANPSLRRIPVIVLTTSRADDDIEKTYDLGVSSYISKPSSAEGLKEVIATLNGYWSNIVAFPRPH